MEKWGPWLVREAEGRFGVRVGPEALEKLERHVAELLRWNRTVNLTAITDPRAVAELHLLDSLAIVPHVTSGARVIDVGSGGGFPGLPLAIVRPDVQVLLVDRTAKKAAFLTSTAARLGLSNVTAAHERVEARERGVFDAAVSRALSDPAVWMPLGRSLVVPGGRVLVMLGADEPEPAGRDAIVGRDRLLEARRYELPGGARRGLWVVERST